MTRGVRVCWVHAVHQQEASTKGDSEYADEEESEMRRPGIHAARTTGSSGVGEDVGMGPAHIETMEILRPLERLGRGSRLRPRESSDSVFAFVVDHYQPCGCCSGLLQISTEAALVVGLRCATAGRATY